MTESGFTIDVDRNQYLPEGGREVGAVVTVTSAADAAGLAGPGPAELAVAIQDGLEARKQGDEETATAKLGRAAALGHLSGNEETAKLLAKVVDVVDPETGRVRLRKQVEDADEMALDARSTKTVRARK